MTIWLPAAHGLLTVQALELEKAHDEAQLATLAEYMGQGADTAPATFAEQPVADGGPQTSEASGQTAPGHAEGLSRVRSGLLIMRADASVTTCCARIAAKVRLLALLRAVSTMHACRKAAACLCLAAPLGDVLADLTNAEHDAHDATTPN